MTILKPCKQATMKLQGNVSNTGAAKGAIWQVLPVFSELMKGFEKARQRHKPLESQSTSDLPNRASPALSPLATQAPTRSTNTRRHQQSPVGKASATASNPAVVSESNITTPAASQAIADDFAQSQIDARFNFNALEHYYNHNINAAWQKLDAYYTRTDDTPIYRAVVLLHPRLKWRWFERYWESKPQWIVAARESIAGLWSEYKHRVISDPNNTANANANATAVPADEDDEWSNDDDATGADQLWLYEQEPHSKILMKESPIPYWVSKRSI
jgi:hypothetical protein